MENTYSPGFVYVYRAGLKGDWKLFTKLSADSATNNDGFGKSIALDSSTALISSVTAGLGPGRSVRFTRDASGAWRRPAGSSPRTQHLETTSASRSPWPGQGLRGQSTEQGSRSSLRFQS